MKQRKEMATDLEKFFFFPQTYIHALHVIQPNKEKRRKLVILYIQNNREISVRLSG